MRIGTFQERFWLVKGIFLYKVKSIRFQELVKTSSALKIPIFSLKKQHVPLQKGLEEAFRSLYRDWETDRKSTRLNSSHSAKSRMPSSA